MTRLKINSQRRVRRDQTAAPCGTTRTPYQIAREFKLIGAFASGRKDTSENYKRYLRERLRAKHSR